MLSFTKEQIKEISDQLNCGFHAFYHKLSGELIFVPDTDKHLDMETDAWQNELDKLENNFLEYQQIEAMESRESFNVMVDFTENVSDKYLHKKLVEALNSKKPFRAFKFIIDDLPERQNWFAFKDKRYIEWTEDQLKILEELNRRKIPAVNTA